MQQDSYDYQDGSYDDDGDDYDVVSFLHQAGDRYKEHLQQLRRERHAEMMQEVTGKPTITPYAAAVRHSNHTCVQERLHDLWQKRLEREKAQLALQEKREAEAAEKSLKQPKITSHAKELKSRGSQAEISEKFLNEHRARMLSMQEAAMRRDMEEMLPRPQINEMEGVGAERKQGRDIADHLLSLNDEKQRKLYEKVETKNSHFSHQPKITQRARSMQRDGDVVSRLYAQNNQPYAYDEEYARHCTFTPNTGSHRYRDPLEHLPVHLRVSERQVKHKSRNSFDDDSVAMHPQISMKSEYLVQSKRQRDMTGTASMSPTSRLYEEGMRSLAGTAEATKDEGANDECTFTPRINPSSKKIVDRKIKSITKSLTTTEKKTFNGRQKMDIERENTRETARQMLWEDAEKKTKKAMDAIRKERKEAEMAACTPFNKKKTKATPKKTSEFYRRGELWTQRRDARLREEKAMLDESEVTECTFQPAVHNEIPVPLRTAAGTAGSELHLERMSRARAQREEANRIKEARPSTTPGRSTKPKEFSLSTSRRRTRHNGEIASLRRPIDRTAVESLDEDGYDNSFDEPRQEAPQPQEYNQQHSFRNPQHHTRGPYTYGAGGADPSAVDFILSNHQNIVRGLNY